MKNDDNNDSIQTLQLPVAEIPAEIVTGGESEDGAQKNRTEKRQS